MFLAASNIRKISIWSDNTISVNDYILYSGKTQIMMAENINANIYLEKMLKFEIYRNLHEMIFPLRVESIQLLLTAFLLLIYSQLFIHLTHLKSNKNLGVFVLNR